MLACLASPAKAITIAPEGPFTNKLATNPITVDGIFTNPLEWSGVIPRAFRSGTPAQPVSLLDPLADSFLYAVIAPGSSAATVELYLLYDYLSRTNRSYAPGDTIAKISFPIVSGDLD